MAANDLIADIPAFAFQPPSSNAPQLSYDDTGKIMFWKFDQTTVESLLFLGLLPKNATSGAGFTVTLLWAINGTDNVVWSVKFDRIATNTRSTNTAPTYDTATSTTVAGTAGNQLKYSEISVAYADLDGLLPGENFLMSLERTASDAADNFAGDATLVAISIRET